VAVTDVALAAEAEPYRERTRLSGRPDEVEGPVHNLPRALRAHANRAAVMEKASPRAELGAIGGRKASSFSSAVPPTCQKEEARAVSGGQPRSLQEGG
jgi:hypothetical protein